MANNIRLKRSAVQGKIPLVGDLSLGEMAINTYDGKLFLKRDTGTQTIVEVGEVTYNKVVTALGYTPFSQGGGYVQGSVTFNHTATLPVITGITPVVQLQGTDASKSSLSITDWQNSATQCATIYLSKSKSGAVNTKTTVVDGDALGRVDSVGTDGTNHLVSARIQYSVKGAVATNSIPTRISFSNTPVGGTALVERAAIAPSGELLVGVADPVADAGVIQVSNGVTFRGTASSNVNTLDWYEEGTFTPSVVAIDSAGVPTATTVTYTERVGRYTRIGNTVIINTLKVVWNTGSGTGTLGVTGLPFTASTAYQSPLSIYTENLDLTPGVLTMQGTSIANLLTTTTIAISLEVDSKPLERLPFQASGTISIAGPYQAA